LRAQAGARPRAAGAGHASAREAAVRGSAVDGDGVAGAAGGVRQGVHRAGVWGTGGCRGGGRQPAAGVQWQPERSGGGSAGATRVPGLEDVLHR
jgi:hypothetical protein